MPEAEAVEKVEEIMEVASGPPAPPKAQLMIGKGGLQFTDLDGMHRFAVMVVQTSLCPKDVISAEKPVSEAMARIQMGLEVGLAPMFALRNVAIINGRPCLWGNALRALVQNHADCEEFSEYFEGEDGTDEFTACCTIKRKGRSAVTMKFSYADAKVAGLWGRNVWKPYPKDMARGKAMSRATQATFADALGGLISEQEARDSPPLDVTDSATAAAGPPTDLLGLTEVLNNEKRDDAPEAIDQDGAKAPDPDPPDEVEPQGQGAAGEDPPEVNPGYEGYIQCKKCASLFIEEASELNADGLCADCAHPVNSKA